MFADCSRGEAVPSAARVLAIYHKEGSRPLIEDNYKNDNNKISDLPYMESTIHGIRQKYHIHSILH